MSAERLQFDRVAFDSTDAAALVGAQRDEVLRRGGAGDLAPPRETSEFEPPDGVFIVLREDGRAIGCGGACRFDESRAELKRMYLAPEARGRGLGRLLLQQIEEEARRLGYTGVVLETITLMSEALGLYRSAGYRQIPSYGAYAGNPTSRCFEKAL